MRRGDEESRAAGGLEGEAESAGMESSGLVKLYQGHYVSMAVFIVPEDM